MFSFLSHHLSLSRSAAVIPSFVFVSHAEAQYPSRYEQKSERRHGLSHAIVSTSVICVLLSAVVQHGQCLCGPPTVVICLQSPHHNKNVIYGCDTLSPSVSTYVMIAATIRATGVHAEIVNVHLWKCDIISRTSFGVYCLMWQRESQNLSERRRLVVPFFFLEFSFLLLWNKIDSIIQLYIYFFLLFIFFPNNKTLFCWEEWYWVVFCM